MALALRVLTTVAELRLEDARLMRVLAHGIVGEPYNVGAENERTNLQVVEMICGLLEDLAPVRTNPAMVTSRAASYRDLMQFVADRPGHDRRYALDCTKLWQLGWAPRYPFASALETTVRWYRDNPAWWRQLKSGEFRVYYERQYGSR